MKIRLVVVGLLIASILTPTAFVKPVQAAILPTSGLWFEYWELPVVTEVNPPVYNFTALPPYDEEPYRNHTLLGKRVDNFNLSGALRNQNFGARFTGEIQIAQAGSYTFYVNSDDGTKLWVDGALVVDNDGAHAPVEKSGITSLSAGRHKIRLDYFQKDAVLTLDVQWAGPGFSKQFIPNGVLYRPTPLAGESEVHSFGTLSRDMNLLYNYAPSFMYDERENRFKIWFCGAGSIYSGFGGDNVAYKEGATLDALRDASPISTLGPSNDPTKFDDQHSCDPNVYRVGSSYYLAYTGNTRNTSLSERGRIGMAISDSGRSFTRLHGGNHIIEPDPNGYHGGYGVGQPAVVRANDGYFYMLYTNAPDPDTNLPPGQLCPDPPKGGLSIVRSTDPAFSPGQFTPVIDLPLSAVGAQSIDMVYDPVSEQFIVIANLSGPCGYGNRDFAEDSPTRSVIRLNYFDRNWNRLGAQDLSFTTGWSFGEGVALLRTSEGHLLRPNCDGGPCFVFAGAADVGNRYANANINAWASWVAGDFKYAMVPDPAGWAQTNYSDWPVGDTAASSQLQTWPVANLKDGAFNNVWSSNAHASPDSTEWIAYWFDGFHEVNYIRLRPRLNADATAVLAFPVNFTVYYSNGPSWVKIADYVDYPKPDPATWAVIPLANKVNANGIHIVATKLSADDYGTYYFQLDEARAGYDPQLETGWNVTSTYASSEFSPPWSKDHLNDHDLGSYWSSVGHPAPDSAEAIAYWFDGFHPVNYLRLAPRYLNGTALGFPLNFELYYSTGSAWQLITTYSNYPAPTGGNWVMIPLPNTVNNTNAIHLVARRLGQDNAGIYIFQLAEVQAGYFNRLNR